MRPRAEVQRVDTLLDGPICPPHVHDAARLHHDGRCRVYVRRHRCTATRPAQHMVADGPTFGRVRNAQRPQDFRVDPFVRRQGIPNSTSEPTHCQEGALHRRDHTGNRNATTRAAAAKATSDPLGLPPQPSRCPNALPREVRAELLWSDIITNYGLKALQALAADLEHADRRLLPSPPSCSRLAPAAAELDLHSEDSLLDLSHPARGFACNPVLRSEAPDCTYRLSRHLRAQSLSPGEPQVTSDPDDGPEGARVVQPCDAISQHPGSVDDTKGALLG
mmetsp:Transcript_52307/g.135420  ORF Transcript_52307/g.135420 Transcript_52307/m.135420 type:complete len:277 (-) Transcript_52307:251-1081(-)